MKQAASAFAVLTLAMTWPITRHLSSVAAQHHDVYFNIWRLQWFAHALRTAPAHLFDTNIFYPEAGTLALSDAMPLQGLLAAPLVFARLPPVLVHNLLMLVPIAASGAAMFALARYLTGSRGAALAAGIAFAYAPYRFDHLGHMELQWAFWMPLAFLALHRTLDTGRWKYGFALGACVALQILSCIYYGIFLVTILPPAAVLLSIRDRQVAWTRAIAPIAAGVALALAVSVPYALPFARQHAEVGDRSTRDVDSFSARPWSYLSVPEGNALYGDPASPGRQERRLFPGSVIVLLALTGLLLRPPSRRQIVYLLLLVAAFEASLGFNGFLYPALARLLPAYRSLRSMGRFGIVVMMALSVLGAYGYAALMSGRTVRVRRMLCAAVACALLLEYRTHVAVAEFPNTAPPLYRMLARLPRGIVAELPMPEAGSLPGSEPRYVGMSIFHWFPLVNGYSGNYPPSYLSRITRMHGFPDARSLLQLRRDGVRYVIVHRDVYSPAALEAIHAALSEAGMAELIELSDGEGPAHLFEVR